MFWHWVDVKVTSATTFSCHGELLVLPTSPFLLLAAFFFTRLSLRFHQWLLAMPIFGAAVIDWSENRFIRPRAKALCASMLLASLFIIWRSSQIALVVQIGVSLIIVSVGNFVVTRKSR
jgi:uncharacterized protein